MPTDGFGVLQTDPEVQREKLEHWERRVIELKGNSNSKKNPHASSLKV